MDRAGLRRFRARAQLVFQNPYDALNPRFTIGAALSEPLVSLGVPRAEHAGRVAEAAAGSDVALSREEWYRIFRAAGHTLP